MKRQIGVVGVDSGQILVCDPCYIDSEWKHEEFTDIRRYELPEHEMVLQYGRDFKRFDEIIKPYGKSMNDMIESKEAIELPQIPAHYNFSYNACCKRTNKDDEKENNGQLDFEMGHAGVGVVTSSGYGDGLYPVIAEYTKDGRVKSITVLFIDDDEDDSITEESREEEDDFLNNDPPEDDE